MLISDTSLGSLLIRSVGKSKSHCLRRPLAFCEITNGTVRGLPITKVMKPQFDAMDAETVGARSG